MLLELFTDRGAVEGCWCQFWRLSGGAFEEHRGAANRCSLKEQVDRGERPGLLALRAGQPVGWCAVGPRERFNRIERSRTLRRIDALPVWSVPCFFVRRD